MAQKLNVLNMNKCIGCFTCMNICAAANKKNHSLTKSAIKVRTSGGLSGRFIALVCRACQDEQACVSACPTGALEERKGGGVTLNPDKCIGCQRCVESCVAGAINFDHDEKKTIVCKHCGLCARFCPHECLEITGGKN